jgi:hypothetical protein
MLVWSTETEILKMLVEMQNGENTLKTTWQFLTVKYTPTKYNSIPRYLLTRNENLRSHKNLYKNVCRTCIPNCPKLEKPQRYPPIGR